MEDLTTLTDEEFSQLVIDVNQERLRRQTLRQAESQIDELNRRYLNAKGVDPGEEWQQPQGAHDAYPQGWQVARNGKTWESTVKSNVWEPGVSGWREVTPEGGAPAEWIQPTGAHDAYQTGDQVTFEGTVYESVIDNNTWSPTEHPPGWSEV